MDGMGFYSFFVNLYNQFLSIFPPQLQWIITLIIVIGLVAGFINLIRHNALFLVVLIIFLPIIIPILRRFFLDLYNFFLYLLTVLQVTKPVP